MLEECDSASKQASITYIPTSLINAGNVILTDEAGNEIINQYVDCNFSAITLSDTAIEVGKTYIITCQDTQSSLIFDQLSVTVQKTK